MSEGRHRKPSNTGFDAAAIATSGALALVPLAVSSAPATAETAAETAAVRPAAAPTIHFGAHRHAEPSATTGPELYRFADVTRAGRAGAPRHAAPAKPPAADPPASGGETYLVRPGDTLSTIATARGGSWQRIWAANRAEVPRAGKIFPGQRLRLPAAGAASAALTVPKPEGTQPATPRAAPSRPVVPKPRAAVPAAGATKPAPVTNLAPRGASKQMRVFLTGYSFQDNTPAGSAEVSHPILHKDAGGTGTFADPITVASPGSGGSMEWRPGTRFYLPSVKRYVIVEDSGASGAPGGVDTHLDMWIDGERGSKSATDACMDRITGEVSAQLNPPPGLPVVAGPVFGQSCNVPRT
jgi:hypothetical protein